MARKVLEKLKNYRPNNTHNFFHCIAYGLVLTVLLIYGSGCGKVLSESERVRVLNERTGNHIQTESERTFVLLYNDEVTKELKKLALRLSNASPKQLVIGDVYVLNTSWINAFVTPNGTIFITTGLLDTLSNKGELAFVLARSMILSQHTQAISELASEEVSTMSRSQVSTFFTDFLASIANVLAYYLIGTTAELFSYEKIMTVEKLGEITSNPAFYIVAYHGYGSSSELKADRLAAEVLESTGYKAVNGFRVLVKLDKNNKENPRITSNSSLVNASPGLTRRIAAYRDYLARRSDLKDFEKEEYNSNDKYYPD